MLTTEDKRTQVVAHAVCILFTALALLPFILMIVVSFTDNDWASVNGYTYFPKLWSLKAYSYIGLQWAKIGKAYLMTILVTAIGTVTNLVLSCTFAYAISHRDIPGMKLLNMMLVLTMLFSGGIVASYYVYVKYFHIKDTIWALIVPNYLMNAFHVILIRNYYVSSIPAALTESAKIDGASEYTVFSRIIIPLSKPIIATVGLMVALGYWNDWLNGIYYLTERGGSNLYTIQIVLNNINDNIQVLKANAGELAKMGSVIPQLPSTTIRMAIAVVGILPVMVAYPFFQQYFVKGITLGAVKE